jgi:hypothetical protein
MFCPRTTLSDMILVAGAAIVLLVGLLLSTAQTPPTIGR